MAMTDLLVSRVRESKVYRTEEEANDVVQMNKARQVNSRKL